MHSLIGLIILGGMSACQPSDGNADKFIFRYNESGGIGSLDPAFARDKSSIWATNQLFNGLLQMDENLHIQPAIAHAYKVSEDGLEHKFWLRSDVYFHKNKCFGSDSTRAVRAHDFVYSFQRLQDADLASPGRWTLDIVQEYYAESDTVFIVRLKEPFPPFLGVLTMKYCSVVPHEAVKFYGSSFSVNPVGTGPFAFRAWYANEKLVLNKNPLYFEIDENGKQLPYADGVSIRFIVDQQAAFLEFLKGNIDLVSGLDPGYKDEIISPQGELKTRYQNDFVLEKMPYLNTEYLIINVDTVQNGVLSDVRLRQAINLGFDRKKMILYLRNNIGHAADGGIIPSGLPGSIAGEGYDYNPEQAKELIRQVQQHWGELPLITLTTVANYRDLCEFIQSELAKIGLNIQVDVVPAANLREQKSQGVLPFFRASWIADYPDAENYLSLFYGPNRSPFGPNYSRFFNSHFDDWYMLARQTTEPNIREALYKKMDSLIVAEAPIVPLFYDEVVRIYPKKIMGLRGNAMNLLDLRYVTK